MKAIIPHPFFIHAYNFTRDSMIKEIVNLAKCVFLTHMDQSGGFMSDENYVYDDGKQKAKYKVKIVQTRLIDILYEICCLKQYGSKTITRNETLHLINLYNDYENIKEKELLRNNNVILYVLGFLGEQKKFQGPAVFFEEFAREKYILDVVSYNSPKDKTCGIDFKKEFLDETGYSTDDYSAILLLVWFLLTNSVGEVTDTNIRNTLKYKNPILSPDNVLNVINKYCISVDAIRNHPLKRQVFYAYPIIKDGDTYIPSNPYLLLALFANSNYWVLRNKYLRLGKKSQNFTNAFGCYYETYFADVLENCLSANSFERIPEENSAKRADWHIKMGNYNFIVEQKSSISLLGIKQSHPDVNALKKHLTEHWKEAIEQLNNTQTFYKYENTIKVILVYEDYYISAALDELYKLDPSITNDNKVWLVTVNEFESLLQLYKKSPDIALSIIDEKDRIETTRIYIERDLKQLFFKNGIDHNIYLEDSGIYDDQFMHIQKSCE